LAAKVETVKKRIAMWAGAGILGAGLWVALIYATTLEQFLFIMAVPLLRMVLYLVCPVMYLAQHLPLKLWGVVLSNAATSTLVGLMVEMFVATLRKHIVTEGPAED
jgi:hypothetical protein